MFPFTRRHDGSPSVVHLVRSVFSDALRLAGAEIDLVKARFSRALKRAGIAVCMLFAAATLAFLGAVGVLVVAGLALATVLPAWAAALVVASALLLAGGGAGMLGVSQLRAAMDAKSAGPLELEVERKETRYRLEAELESLSAKLDPRHRRQEQPHAGSANGRAR